MDAAGSLGPKLIHKVVRLLQALASGSPETGLRELAAKAGIPRSTTHRILQALEQEGIVEVNTSTGSYRLGLELVPLAGSVLRNSDLRSIAFPSMVELSAQWGETIDLDVLRGADIIVIEQVPGKHILATSGTFAARLPAHCTSTGRVLLAHAGREYVEAHLPEELPAYTKQTITSRSVLLQVLAEVREQGYARIQGEYDELVCAIGVPIRDRSGVVIAAMAISGPVSRVGGPAEAELIDAMVTKAKAISARMAYIDFP